MERIVILFRLIYPEKPLRAFIRHNKSLWNHETQGRGELLFEYNDMHSAVIAYSYLAQVLAKKYKATIIPFLLEDSHSFFIKIHNFLLRHFESLYRSFGAGDLLIVKIKNEHEKQAELLFQQIYPGLITKQDIEGIKIKGTIIGDLIYDHFLRKYSVPTIELTDPLFKQHLKDFLALVIMWQKYLESHDVKAVNVSHTVYKTAILPRLAIAYGIPAYQCNATHIYSLDKQHLLAYVDFSDYKKIFKTLSKQQQEAGLKEAALRLQRRFSGEVGVDMKYSTRSAYTREKVERLLDVSDKKKILIATHCFFDSPHPYGINLFPDFYEWLTFLGKLSEETDYEWYIKSHPDFLPGNIPILEQFVQRYPKFKQLSSNASHHQIIEEGIDLVLTVYGTIGFEYAALGVPVINASTVNPHNAYNFNLHPQTQQEYRNILLNLNDLHLSVKLNEVHEFYFMKHIYNTDNWLFNNYEEMVAEMGGYKSQFTPEIYDYFLKEFDQGKHRKILNSVSKFVDSKDYRLNTVHTV